MESVTAGIGREVAVEVVTTASLAPSIHNTQPWRWRLADGLLTLRAEVGRRLAVLDPDGRQLLVSCGAALLHARLACRVLGLEPVVELLPGASTHGGLEPVLSDDLVLASLGVGGRLPPADNDRLLFSAAGARHTDRRPFEARSLDSGLVDRMRRAAEAEGAWLMPLAHSDQRLDAAVVAARADWAEQTDPAYRAELASWRRGQGPTGDGVPTDVAGTRHPFRASDFPLRDFDTSGAGGGLTAGNPGGGPVADTTTDRTATDRTATDRTATDPAAGGSAPAGVPRAAERPTIIVLGTDADQAEDRLRAGQALARVLLTVTAAGAAASPLGQPVDSDAYRSVIGRMLSITGHVQMILRVGYPRRDAVASALTPRRPIAEILTFG
ncbi:nitroreductase family protein [Frankia sp. EI5c]|uniref:Acg family FMN-binding oxidoreductase n=1 Tax=Frankia sp. EI5c TaxID=683316 RepID=UPI0007C2E0DD|nr:nitroreductase family protein [Frankia sp. EI5c]OAA18060.1 nitroreductase family protein [Frankia sp. EI5c]